jgi:hypothetical protein
MREDIAVRIAENGAPTPAHRLPHGFGNLPVVDKLRARLSERTLTFGELHTVFSRELAGLHYAVQVLWGVRQLVLAEPPMRLLRSRRPRMGKHSLSRRGI